MNSSNSRKPMNPSTNSQRVGSVSLDNFDFDFGITPNNSRSQPLNQQKKHQALSSSTSTPFLSSQNIKPSPSWTPNKPSWIHQPAPSSLPNASNSSSMVGDIFGKSWGFGSGSGSGSGKGTSGIGIVEKNPSLFGDLVGSALGGKSSTSSSNVPLKNLASKVSAATSGNAGDLKGGNVPVRNAGRNYTGSSGKHVNFGGLGMKSGTLGSTGSGNRDPFGSLLDFGAKKQQPISSSSVAAGSGNKKGGGDDFLSGSANVNMNVNVGTKVDGFGAFDIPVQSFNTQKNSPPKSHGFDPLDRLFQPSSGTRETNGMGNKSQSFGEVDDWGVGTKFGGNDDVGNTTELDGLPPPPSGMTASGARNKGIESKNQGQHADAIKFLSWAVVLFDKAGDNAGNVEILSARASCYKEVGEYKKAIADCTKVLEHDGENVSVLVQRALLYESNEKYKLGAEDLRMVLKIDPGNRLARSTIHRLVKMAE